MRIYKPTPHRRRHAHHGFTLVELLVVIAIIGVLVALLLPAIQAAREAARRVSCINNITQLGISVHNYEFHHEVLPSGVINPDGPIRNEPIGQHVSWIVTILPYIEQTVMYRKFDIELGAYAPENAEVRGAQIESIRCPSYPGPDYYDEGRTIANSNYAACYNDSEAPIDVKNNGLMFLNSRVRYSDIFDGSSNTLLLSEFRYPEEGLLGWVSGTRATLRNTSKIEPPRPRHPIDPQNLDADGQEIPQDPFFVGGFSSAHAGGLNAAFADGSTRFLRSDIDPAILRLYGNRSDGEIIKSEY
jgi:prepilin-type N-terminal cleavage/methylation domain-containing protein/prepilin-type processing-associated H-X9-DG protein